MRHSCLQTDEREPSGKERATCELIGARNMKGCTKPYEKILRCFILSGMFRAGGALGIISRFAVSRRTRSGAPMIALFLLRDGASDFMQGWTISRVFLKVRL